MIEFGRRNSSVQDMFQSRVLRQNKGLVSEKPSEYRVNGVKGQELFELDAFSITDDTGREFDGVVLLAGNKKVIRHTDNSAIVLVAHPGSLVAARTDTGNPEQTVGLLFEQGAKSDFFLSPETDAEGEATFDEDTMRPPYWAGNDQIFLEMDDHSRLVSDITLASNFELDKAQVRFMDGGSLDVIAERNGLVGAIIVQPRKLTKVTFSPLAKLDEFPLEDFSQRADRLNTSIKHKE